MNKKYIIFFVISIFFSINIFSQSISFSDLTLEEFLQEVKTSNINSEVLYTWSGIITEVKENENNIEAVAIKSKWITKNKLVTNKFIIKADDNEIIKKIKKVGLLNKIIIIVRVESIIDNKIPVCIPLLIKKL